MTTSQKTAAWWLMSMCAALLYCLLQLCCGGVAPAPVPDAAATVPADLGQPLPDLAPAIPACVPCSWMPPYSGCDPSLCMMTESGQLCCRPRRRGGANGRRRWRREAKRYRRGHHRHWMKSSAEYRAHDGQRIACGRSGACKRRHAGLKNGLFITDLTPLRPLPWSTRSLVGMTMGSRKRAAQRARAAALALLEHRPADPARLAAMRSIYRIGERLRPCPGCRDCDDSAAMDLRRFVLLGGRRCEMSGVIPARPKRRR